MQQHAECLAIAAAAPMVVVEDDVAGRRHQLHLCREIRPVAERRAAMDLEDHRVRLALLVAGRRDVPALDRRAVQ